MSSSKGKAKVSQTDLRRIMQQMKVKRHTSDKHCSSAPTTHNPASSLKRGQPLGNGTTNAGKKIKLTETLRKDVEKITILKPELGNALKTKILEGSSLASSQKRSNPFENGVQRPTAKIAKVNEQQQTTSKLPLISCIYSDSSSDDEADSVPMARPSRGSLTQSTEAGPSTSQEVSKSIDTTQALPEGFFDDPEVDAKMRGVETPADKMDREWESFQRELQHEEGQSEQLIEEEKETEHLDREIEEIDEQIKLYNIIEKLSDKKDTAVLKLKNAGDDIVDHEAMSSGSEEEDIVLDWREKDAFT